MKTLFLNANKLIIIIITNIVINYVKFTVFLDVVIIFVVVFETSTFRDTANSHITGFPAGISCFLPFSHILCTLYVIVIIIVVVYVVLSAF